MKMFWIICIVTHDQDTIEENTKQNVEAVKVVTIRSAVDVSRLLIIVNILTLVVKFLTKKSSRQRYW